VFDDQYKQLYEDGIILNISQYIKGRDFPNIERHFQRRYVDIYEEADGFYRIPVYTGPYVHATFIRKDWLEKLGLQIPKTYEDLRNVMKVFVEKDPDGNRTTGMTARSVGWLNHIFVGFTGVYPFGWTKKSGEWTYMAQMPGYKQAITYLSDLYREELLDREFAILNTAQAYEKMANGRAGVIMSSMVHYEMMAKPLKENKPGADLTLAVPFPEGPAGPYRYEGYGFWSYGVIAKGKSDDIKLRVLSFLDHINSPEGQDLISRGIEGVHYEMKEGKTAEIAATRERDFSHPVHILANLINQGERMYDPYKGVFQDNVKDAIKNGIAPEVVGLSTEKTKEIGANIGEVNTKWKIDFITGAANVLTQWDQYMNELKRAGIDEYKAEVEKYMSGK